ncbi:DNA alkylation repair protein [Kiritimatiellaeota bacterium B1221]|nr:DNA alkylation repair protein [Kiritimatiellaeota bacterium B1221]
MPQADKKKFKDWFDQEAAQRLALQIASVYKGFNQISFIKQADHQLSSLEMNARVHQFSQALADHLPADKQQALEILTDSLPEILPGTDQVTDGWLQWPVGKFIADYGLPHFDTAMTAMVALTQRFSSEFAVRPFVETFPDETIAQLSSLTSHPSPHVRRWCSEGTRPLLPWGKKLTALVDDPSPVWPILEALKDDPEPYVQKSVANHLNDISKHHPNLVIDRCRQWLKQDTANRKWIVRHALRTLIKAGNPDALALIGYFPAKKIKVNFRVTPAKIRIGEHTFLKLEVHNQNPGRQKLLIDYAVTYVRQKGKTGRKVFKWTTLELLPQEKRNLQKAHAMKVTSIRALYPGVHQVDVLVNGAVIAQNAFTLSP